MRTWRPISCPPSQTEVSVRRAVERPLCRWNRHVCGRYQRRSNKQRISEAFSLSAMLMASPSTFTMKDDQPFAQGGVWRHWRSPDRKTEMDTFAIITVEPNELVAEKTGHDRMPLIVKRTDYQRWLEPGSAEQPPVDLLRHCDARRLCDRHGDHAPPATPQHRVVKENSEDTTGQYKG